MENNSLKKNVIVIGAGPAGLTAAFELLKQDPDGYQVTVLEESNEMGGISRTVKYNGNRMDIGGHRFFSKDKRVMDWWRERMPLQGEPSKDDILTETKKPLNPDGPDPEKVDIVMLLRNRVSRIYYLKKFFDYPISMKVQTFKNMGFKKTMQAGFSYLGAVAHKLPETSLENFYTNRFGKKLYSMFFENYTEKLWGRHPSAISADWGAQRVKGLSVMKIIEDVFSKALPAGLKKNRPVETSLIEQFWYPKFGPGQLWELTASQVGDMGGTIRKNCKVVGLKLENGQIKSVNVQENGEDRELTGDIFLSSMPLKDLVQDMGTSVPENIHEIASGLPYRDFITVGLLLSEIKLKNETKTVTPYNRIPDCWIYIQEPNIKMGRMQIFNNWSPYMVRDLEKTIGVGLEYFCNEGDRMWTMPDEDFIRFAISEMVSMGIIDEDNVIETHIEHVKKAYPAYFDTYNQIDTLIEWLNQIDNLYCIGRNGQHRYNNSDHSMATAFEAVKNIRGNIRSRDNIWKVNTEKVYHETASAASNESSS